MSKRVDQTLSDLPLEKTLESVLAFLERELKPIVRRLRESNNELTSTDLTALEADIAALEAADTAFDTRLDGDEADITDHEARIAALEAAETDFRTTSYSQSYTSVGANAATTYYWMPYGDGRTVPGTTIELAQLLVNRSGNIKNLSFYNKSPNGDNDTFSLTLNVNGSATALTITGLTPNLGTLQEDITHSVAVVKGDRFCFEQVNDGAMNVNSRSMIAFDFEES